MSTKILVGIVLLSLSIVYFATTAFCAQNVLTFHNDNARTGWNSHEAVLNPQNVNQSIFGKIWQTSLNEGVCGSPLYVSGLTIAGQTHNVVFAATNANSVYALDAATGAILWGPVTVSDPINDVAFEGSGSFHNLNGIISTPVIDLNRGLIYVCAPTQPKLKQIWQVWALDITSGKIAAGYPIQISGSYDGCDFDGGQLNQRGALLLVGDQLYIPFGSRQDRPDWHGWIVGVDVAHPSAPMTLWTPDPTDEGGGIWGVGGPSADAAGNLFVVIGNGANNYKSGGKNLGQSIVRLSTIGGKLKLGYTASDCFVPSNFQYLNDTDEDLGGGGGVLFPAPDGLAQKSLLITGGKDGIVYIVDQSLLGGVDGQVYKRRYFGDGGQADLGEIRAVPAYFDSGDGSRWVFVPGENPGPDGEKGIVALRLTADDNKKLLVKQVWTLNAALARPGSPIVTSDGEKNPIVWITEPELHEGPDSKPGALHAYDALTGVELYNSEQNVKRDHLDQTQKFSAPVVAEGKVFVGIEGIAAFGLLSSASPGGIEH